MCGVVFEGSTRATGCQFTFTCDGSMARAPMTSEWARARKVAWAALNGAVHAAAGLATHYHANYVLPYWASSLVKTHVEGAAHLLSLGRRLGPSDGFPPAYAAREADSRVLREAALSVEHVLPKVLVEGTAAAAAIEKLDEIEGVKVAEAGERVSIKFNLKAREAVEKVVVTPYVERVAASDNLRRALDGAAPAGADAKPFGPPADAKDEARRTGQLTRPRGGAVRTFIDLEKMARVTGLEPAASGVTGRRSNQLSYTRALVVAGN